MKRDEQHRMILALREREGRMAREDKDLFSMLLKRDRDDEDLDAESLRRLKGMYERYVRKRTKEELDGQWKNLTGG